MKSTNDNWAKFRAIYSQYQNIWETAPKETLEAVIFELRDARVEAIEADERDKDLQRAHG